MGRGANFLVEWEEGPAVGQRIGSARRERVAT